MNQEGEVGIKHSQTTVKEDGAGIEGEEGKMLKKQELLLPPDYLLADFPFFIKLDEFKQKLIS